MGHANYKIIQAMNTARSLHDFFPTKATILVHPCNGYMLGKQHKATYFSDPDKKRSFTHGAFFHVDVYGRIKTPSLQDSEYYILYKDDCTTFRFVHFAKHKSEAYFFFKRLTKVVKCDTKNDIVKLHIDRGTEFCNNNFDNFLADRAIAYETSTSYTPQQNSFIERDNMTVMEMARSMLLGQNLPKRLWVEAVAMVVHILNRTVNTQVGDQIPFELSWFKTKPIVSHNRVFGAMSYVFINKELCTKLDPKNFQGYFVGYSVSSRAYRF
jgi:hypothetical protein